MVTLLPPWPTPPTGDESIAAEYLVSPTSFREVSSPSILGTPIAVLGDSALSDKGKPVVRLGRKATGLGMASR